MIIRDKTWNWLTDDFFTRFSDHAALLMTLTRWHVDDPAGRFLERFPETEVLDYHAIADAGRAAPQEGRAALPRVQVPGVPGRAPSRPHPGVAGSASTSRARSSRAAACSPSRSSAWWRPCPIAAQVAKAVRYWDKAATEDGGAYTAGVKMLKLKDGRFLISDVRRGQLAALAREKLILQTAKLDRAGAWCRAHRGGAGARIRRQGQRRGDRSACWRATSARPTRSPTQAHQRRALRRPGAGGQCRHPHRPRGTASS